MKSIKFSEKISIKGNQTEIFDYTQDYEKRISWDTFLTRAEIIDGSNEAALGVKTYCKAKNGMGMETEYVSFKRPKVTAIKMTKGPIMFKTFLGSWTFSEESKNLTEVTFLYSFQLRIPFNFFSSVIIKKLKKDVRKRLRDLKENIERK